MSQPTHTSSSKSLKKNLSKKKPPELLSKENILKEIYTLLKNNYEFDDITIFLLDPFSEKALCTYPKQPNWRLPKKEEAWLLSHVLENKTPSSNSNLLIHTTLFMHGIYIKDRNMLPDTDPFKLKEDINRYQYACKDGLYLLLIGDKKNILGIIFIHNWNRKQALHEKQDMSLALEQISKPLCEFSQALNTAMLHYQIDTLNIEKKKLKAALHINNEIVKKANTELNILHTISSEINTLLDYKEIINLTIASLNNAIHFDLCNIFLPELNQAPEMITILNTPIDSQTLTTLHDNIINAFLPFSKHPIHRDSIDFKTTTLSPTNPLKHSKKKQFTICLNIPLVCKNTIYGLLNISSTNTNELSHQEITFINTVANEIASHLYRLNLIKEIEKTKINSLIKSMTDGVIMLDQQHNIELINTAAKTLLTPFKNHIKNNYIVGVLKKIGLYDTYLSSLSSLKKTVTKDISIGNTSLSIKSTPVLDIHSQRIGTVLVFRDFTEIQKINRIKSQRLDIISKVHLILNTISNLDNLLSVLMEFILTIAQAEMGAIQLKKNDVFQTIVHANFPDKIRKQYAFLDGTSLSDHTIETKKLLVVENYHNNSNMNQDVRIIIEQYLCIPIIVKQNLIGIINIARKKNPIKTALTPDDLETLKTISLVSGSAIYNALLYHESIKKKQLEHELKLAYNIQKDLLPSKLPSFGSVDIGTISVPARDIGGDYYDFFLLDDDHMGILVADIIGKGVPAGLFMAMLKSLLHTNLQHTTSTQHALNKINSVFHQSSSTTKFIPLFYAILNRKTLTLTYSNAGHEPGLVLTGNRFHELDTKGFPIGAYKEGQYEEKKIKLTPSSICFLYTDGIIETRNKQGNLFGLAGLKSTIRKTKYLNSSVITQEIYSKLNEFSESLAPHDDITLITLKMEKPIFKENVLIDKKQIKVPSTKNHIKKIRLFVEKFASQMGFNPSEVFNIKLAINEAHANIIEHAYCEKKDGEILFRMFHYNNKLIVKIRDYSKALPQKTIKQASHLHELEGSGLGTFLIKSVMDEVKYSKTSKYGTEIILTKLKKTDSG